MTVTVILNDYGNNPNGMFQGVGQWMDLALVGELFAEYDMLYKTIDGLEMCTGWRLAQLYIFPGSGHG